MDEDALWTSAVDQQPAGYTAHITNRALLRDPLFTCIHIASCGIKLQEFTQCRAQPAGHLRIPHSQCSCRWICYRALCSAVSERQLAFPLSCLLWSDAILSMCKQLHLLAMAHVINSIVTFRCL